MRQNKGVYNMQKIQPIERVLKVNQLFWDEKLTMSQLEKQMRMGRVTIDRVLFQTREEWEKYKNKLQGLES